MVSAHYLGPRLGLSLNWGSLTPQKLLVGTLRPHMYTKKIRHRGSAQSGKRSSGGPANHRECIGTRCTPLATSLAIRLLSAAFNPGCAASVSCAWSEYVGRCWSVGGGGGRRRDDSQRNGRGRSRQFPFSRLERNGAQFGGLPMVL